MVTGDGLPVFLCLTCKEKLHSAFDFKQQCEKADSFLREQKIKLGNKNNIKEESLDIIIQPDLNISDIYDDDRYSDSGSGDEAVKTKQIYKDDAFMCIYCQKVLRTKKGLKIHQRRHTGEKLRSCHICQAKFTRTNHLVRHMKTHNKVGGEMKHICVECGMGFDRAHLLIKHKKEHKVESNSQNIKMEVAENDIKTEQMQPENPDMSANGIVQGASEVGDDSRFECKFCGKVLTTHMGLRIHMRRHTGRNLANCEVRILLFCYLAMFAYNLCDCIYILLLLHESCLFQTFLLKRVDCMGT